MWTFRRAASAAVLAFVVACSDEAGGTSFRPGEDPFSSADGGTGDYAPPVSCGSASGSGYGGCGYGGAGPGQNEGAGGDGGAGEADAGPPPPPCNELTFRYEGEAESVWLTGTFVAWAATPDAGALPLEEASPGVWTLTTLIEPKNQRHLYKFIVDGERWVFDAQNPERLDDGFGSYNSVLDVCGVVIVEPDTCDATFSWHDPVMYFAMIDRFFDSDGRAMPVAGVANDDARSGPSGQYAGGDLAGVTAKMDYLADLGVTALWLSAPYDNRDTAGAAINPADDPHGYSGYHGYWPSPRDIDYTDLDAPSPLPRVESRIGGAADLRALIEAAHGAESANGDGIKVLFDYVMRHADVESELYKAHPDWFYSENGAFPLCGSYFDHNGQQVMGWDHPYYTTHCAFTSYLAPFDFDNAAARAWSVNDAIWWAKEYGIDGYRLDAIKHVPKRWLTELRERLSAAFQSPAGERFYLVGETFDYGNRELLKSFVDPDTMLDGQFDFPFKARLCESLFKKSAGLDAFASWASENDGYYGQNAIMSTWIGNHDIPRAIHFASGQIDNCMQGSDARGNAWTDDYQQPSEAAPYERLALAFAVMMTSRGVPLIYYGDEVGLAGGGDPDNRRMMPWSDSELNAHQRALREQVRALARIRGENPVLGRGVRTTRSASADTWVYEVAGCEGVLPITVAINRADQVRVVTLPNASYENLVSGSAQAGGEVTLSARSFLVLR